MFITIILSTKVISFNLIKLNYLIKIITIENIVYNTLYLVIFIIIPFMLIIYLNIIAFQYLFIII